MAKIAAPPVPLKAYRHFAIITVAITLMLALFATGENREALENEIEQREQAEQQQQAAALRERGPVISRRDAAGQQRFGGGDTQTFGAPMERLNPGANRGGTVENFVATTGMRQGENLAIPGYTTAYLNSLSEQEYRRLVESLRAAGTFSAEDRAKMLSDLESESRRRAGRASGASGLAQ